MDYAQSMQPHKSCCMESINLQKRLHNLSSEYLDGKRDFPGFLHVSPWWPITGAKIAE